MGEAKNSFICLIKVLLLESRGAYIRIRFVVIKEIFIQTFNKDFHDSK